MNKRDLLTADQVAVELGVSSARVRQLVEEGKLAAPEAYGPRANLWTAAAVKAARRRLAGHRETPQAQLLPAATRPVPRTHDQVIDVPIRRLLDPWRVHVRIWQGEVEGGRRVVVVLGRPQGRGYADVDMERIVAFIDKRFLGGWGDRAVWLETDAVQRGQVRYTLHNVVFTIHDRRRDDQRFANGLWIGIPVSELDRLVGSPVEWWPPAAYDEKSIAHWQRNREQLDVTDDPWGLSALISAVEYLLTVRVGEIPSALARTAVAAISEHALELDLRSDHEWDDGTRDAGADDGPSLFAARLVPYKLASAERELLVAHRPEQAPSVDDLGVLIDELGEWEQQVDEFSDNEDRELAEAIRQVRSTLDHLAGHTLLDVTPDVLPRSLDSRTGTVGAFLEGVTWDNAPARGRARKQLQAELASHDDVEYGRTPSGVDVARVVGSTTVIALWPTGRVVPLRDDDFLVGDALPDDRPVFVERDGQIVGVLNWSAWTRDGGWSWGYMGGGPASLVGAIEDHLALEFPDLVAPREWIQDFVIHSDATFRLPIHELMKRASGRVD